MSAKVFAMRTGIIKTISIKPHNLCASFKCLIHSKGKTLAHKLWSIIGIVLMSPIYMAKTILCWLILAVIIPRGSKARSAVVSELLWNGLNWSPQLVKNLRSQKCRLSVSHVKETHSVLTVRYVSLWFCSKPSTRKWVRLSAHQLQLWDR